MSNHFDIQREKTFILLGDSISSWVPYGDASDLYSSLITQERGVSFKSIASPGHRIGTSGSKGYNNSWITSLFNTICGGMNYCRGIVIDCGTNDYYASVPWADVNSSLARIIQWALAKQSSRPDFRIFMVEPIWRADEANPNGLGLNLDLYRIALAMVAQAYPGLIIWVPAPSQFIGSTTLYNPDEVAANFQLHPNAAGHRVKADALKAVAAAHGIF